MSKIDNLWEEEKEILLYQSKQVAYPIGPNKDAYYINTYHYINGNAEMISSKSEVRKNLHGKDEKLFDGTPHECYNFIKKLVEKLQ